MSYLLCKKIYKGGEVMFSVFGLVIAGMFSVLVYIIFEGLLQMYREHKALKEYDNLKDELYLARLTGVLDE